MCRLTLPGTESVRFFLLLIIIVHICYQTGRPCSWSFVWAHELMQINQKVGAASISGACIFCFTYLCQSPLFEIQSMNKNPFQWSKSKISRFQRIDDTQSVNFINFCYLKVRHFHFVFYCFIILWVKIDAQVPHDGLFNPVGGAFTKKDNLSISQSRRL